MVSKYSEESTSNTNFRYLAFIRISNFESPSNFHGHVLLRMGGAVLPNQDSDSSKLIASRKSLHY